MDVLLDVIDDLVHVPCRVADMQSAAGSSFYDWFIMPLADGRFRVSTKQ
jgi:hypothetical protein